MTKNFFPSPPLLAPSPAAFATSALKTLGYNSRYVTEKNGKGIHLGYFRTCGWWMHGLWVTAVSSLLPEWGTALLMKMIGRVEYGYVQRDKQKK